MRRNKVIINIISSITLQLIRIIYSFIIPKLMITSFGSNVNGLIESITQFLVYITLLESGFGPVIKSILYKPIANKDRATIAEILKTSEKFFRKIAYIFLGYILILCFIFPIMVGNQFDTFFTVSLVIILAVSTFVEYYFGMTYRIYLETEQKVYVISAIQIGTIILNTIAVISLINLGASIQVVKLTTCVIFILRPILQNIYIRKKYNINLKNVEGNYKIEQKWEGLAQHIAYVVHKNTDIVILTIYGSLADISVYSVYLMVISGVISITRSFIGGIDATLGDMLAKGEKDILNKTFNTFEGYYHTIATILFGSTLFLIVPFVKIYTKGIVDANYIRPVFAYIMVLAEFIWAIRQLYNDLVKCAGHFKQTKIGAWIEAITNIVISAILVWKLGLVGVAIGTLFAMSIRTIEFMYYASKYILSRNIWYTFKRLLVIAIEILTISLILNVIPQITITNYLTWIMQAIVVVIIASIVVITTNCIVYKENIKDILKNVKNHNRN